MKMSSEPDPSRLPLHYVRVHEVKTNHGQHRSYKFFLVDNHGQEHLAATAEELSDAHYNYHSTEEFLAYGQVIGHSRKELTMWLEEVIKRSGQAARGEVLDAEHVVHLGPVTAEEPLGTYFVTYRQERLVAADGRRTNQWWLVDQHGKEHLAVIGTERETRDAHYTYSTTEQFSEHPLECNNQAKVLKWIESMLTHAPQGAASEGAQGTTAVDDFGFKHLPLGSEGLYTTGGKPPKAGGGRGGRGGGRGGGRTTGNKHKLVGVAQDAHLKRLRRLAAESEEAVRAAQAAHIVRLRRAAEAEAANSEQVRRGAAHWLRDCVSVEEQESLATALDTLKTLIDKADKTTLQPAAYTALSLDPDLNGLLQRTHAGQLSVPPLATTTTAAAATTTTAQAPGAAPTAGAGPSAPAAGANAPSAPTNTPAHPSTSALPGTPRPSDDPAPSVTTTAGPAATAATTPAAPAATSPSRPVTRHTPTHAQTWTYSDPYLNHHGLRKSLECLRELSCMLPPLQTLLHSDLVDTVRTFSTEHPHPAVTHLARHTIGVWQRAVLSHVRAIVTPRSDPVGDLEAKIAAELAAEQNNPGDILGGLDLSLPTLDLSTWQVEASPAPGTPKTAASGRDTQPAATPPPASTGTATAPPASTGGEPETQTAAGRSEAATADQGEGATAAAAHNDDAMQTSPPP